jgi:superfamily II DNA/RNA helicase
LEGKQRLCRSRASEYFSAFVGGKRSSVCQAAVLLQDVEGKLAARGVSVASLHGELSKMERQSIMRAFRNGELRVLVVSDVAARGLDVPDCDAVFNLELPSDASHYVHRAGRTGRMGRCGTSGAAFLLCLALCTGFVLQMVFFSSRRRRCPRSAVCRIVPKPRSRSKTDNDVAT